MQLVERLLAGDARALSRSISLVEERAPASVDLLQALYARTGRGAIVGVTGAPGSGKSTLVDRLVAAYRGLGRRVGVIAVDPSSAFSGGAILGDRVRMQAHATDPEVFIRSMATRGHLGGLSRATNDSIDLLQAAGYDPILVETVGVGQDEVDIVKTADVVAVVLVPGMGDDVQALKAGILEIGDLFVINKADREGVERLEADLAQMLAVVPHATRPIVKRTVAARDLGVLELRESLDAFLDSAGRTRRTARGRERAEARFLALLEERLVEHVRRRQLVGRAFDALVERIAARELDPYTAVDQVLTRLEAG